MAFGFLLILLGGNSLEVYVLKNLKLLFQIGLPILVLGILVKDDD